MAYLLATLVLIFAAPLAQANVQFGALTATQRLLREDAPPTAKKIRLYAAGNEWRSFQVFLRSDTPVRIVLVQVGNLNGPRGSVIAGSNIRIYREHQLHITAPTYRNADFKPGWYPDALIPVLNPLTGKPLSGARFRAIPFDLPANETHGFWIDVCVQKDARKGDYTGKCVIQITGQPPITLPITLTKWNFTLPDTPTYQTCFGSPADQLPSYYEKSIKAGKISASPDREALSAQCSEMLAENKFSATPSFQVLPVQQPDGSFAIPVDKVNALRQYIDKYHPNVFMVSHPQNWITDPEKEKDKLYALLKAWDVAIAELKRPEVTFAVYLLDEPNDSEAYKYVQKWGRTIRGAHSKVKMLVVEQAKTQDPAWGDLNGAVDIWCPLFSLFDGPAEASRQALGETIWTYTALCQGNPTPWWHTDYPLLNYRIPAWTSWRYGIKGLLYWGGMAYWNAVEDPWTNPATYGSGKLVYNGEGSLLYPAEDVGYSGIVASMRLKALRDSIQDYEYMAILDRAGKTAAAQKVVQGLTPTWYEWEKDPEAYEKVRVEMGRMIEK